MRYVLVSLLQTSFDDPEYHLRLINNLDLQLIFPKSLLVFGVLPIHTFAGTASVCPDDTIRQVTSPLTEMAEVDLSMAACGITQRMKLPVGSYQYERNDGDGSTCLVSVEIKGVLL